MDGQNVVVAVFASLPEAERARDRLIEIGIPATDIRMSDDQPVGPTAAAETDTMTTPRREGFWDWLFGRDVPEYDRPWYESNLREGRTVVSVLVHDPAQRHRIAEILEDFNPIDFEESESRYRGSEFGSAATAAGAYARPQMAAVPQPPTERPLGAPQTWEHERDVAGATAAERPSEGAIGGERTGAGDTVIPVVKEDLEVGKRVHERRYRIRAYTIETPVERDVTLHDERVVIERRPVSDPAIAAKAATEAKDHEFEVIERHEEPMVEKRRTAEEVIVRKEADERTERVRDTVRETKVDIDRGAESEAPSVREHKP
jgi:Domain of unknown function (DUF2382)